MTENKDKLGDKDKDKKIEVEAEKGHEKDKDQQKEQQIKAEQQLQQQHQPTQHDRCKRLSQFMDMLNIPRHHHHHHSGHSGSSSSNTSQQHSPQTPHAAATTTATADCQMAIPAIISNVYTNTNNNINSGHCINMNEEHQHHAQQRGSLYHTTCVSFQSEIFLLDMLNGEINDFIERSTHKDEYGTQRVYKKTSPNCVLTLYLPSREITLSGNSPSILRGIVYVDPKAIQGYRVYAQLTLTFRYGREDEEVMGLRFCNEAIMSLHQIWPRNEEPARDAMSPLQDALLKRLGDGAHPFTLTLTAQAPPSVQLVPAKRYYGAPIGTSYDVRCFIADKTDEKFHRRASVKMGVRVIYRTDVFNHVLNGAENFADLINNTVSSPPLTLATTNTLTTTTPPICSQTTAAACANNVCELATVATTTPAQPTDNSSTSTSASVMPATSSNSDPRSSGKARKSERGDSFPKLRLSPKAFRFSSRFGRSKSEAEKCPNDPFYNYSKSFQEYDSVCATVAGGGPQGAVDKPFLLQDGRVGLRASLDKAWYTHGEDVCVTINIRNDSRKTVRKVRICAIQHVDVCMFNNGKFKNVVADSDNLSPPPIDRHVPPGATLNTTVVLKPHRGPTKNWIALEDTLQRSTEPDEITGAIAASAVRTPHFLMQASHSPNLCSSPAVFIPPIQTVNSAGTNPTTNNDERNVFAIYVSYYVKVKLTLSGMGGELSLKLPFILVHIDEEQRQLNEMQKLNLDDVPANKKNGNKSKASFNKVESSHEFAVSHSLDRIESVDDEHMPIKVPQVNSLASAKDTNSAIEEEEDQQPSTSSATSRRRPLMRSETIVKDLEDEPTVEPAKDDLEQVIHIAQIHTNNHLVDNHDRDIGKMPANIKKFMEQHETFSRQNSQKIKIDDIHIVADSGGVLDINAVSETSAREESSTNGV